MIALLGPPVGLDSHGKHTNRARLENQAKHKSIFVTFPPFFSRMIPHLTEETDICYTCVCYWCQATGCIGQF